MVQLKVLKAVVVIISLTLNSFCSSSSRINKVKNMKQDVVAEDTILLKEVDYNVIFKDNNVLDIKITDVNILHKIKSIISPILNIELGKEFFIAKGNNIFASSLPKGCNYFYPLNNKGMAVIKDGLINFRKVPSN